MALPDLVQVDDEDWVGFQNSDPEWNLRAAGRIVRKYCGWHLWPNVKQTNNQLKMGAKGIIMLPSRFITAVEHIKVHVDVAEQNGQAVVEHEGHMHHDEYEWHQGGWIQLRGIGHWMDWYTAGYYFGSDQYYLPAVGPYVAEVTFHHGYRDVPDDIKAVVFELAQQAMTVGSGNVKSVEAPVFRLQPSQDFGLTLNKDQKGRLANYRIGGVI